MKISEAIDKADSFALWKVFWPVAQWADYRWHINPYKIAIQFFIARTVMVICDTVINMMPIISWLGLLIIPIWLAIAAFEILMLSKVSEKIESNPNPNQMPIEWMFFVRRSSRFLNLWLWLVFVPTDILTASTKMHGSWLLFAYHFIPGNWPLVAMIGYYFAALPKPPAKRKEKKVWVWGNLTPAIAGSK